MDFHEGIGAGKDDFVRDVFVGGLDVVLPHQLGFAGGEVHVDIAVAQDQGDGFQHPGIAAVAEQDLQFGEVGGTRSMWRGSVESRTTLGMKGERPAVMMTGDVELAAHGVQRIEFGIVHGTVGHGGVDGGTADAVFENGLAEAAHRRHALVGIIGPEADEQVGRGRHALQHVVIGALDGIGGFDVAAGDHSLGDIEAAQFVDALRQALLWAGAEIRLLMYSQYTGFLMTLSREARVLGR